MVELWLFFLFCFWGPQELLRPSKKVQILDYLPKVCLKKQGIGSGLYGKSVLYLLDIHINIWKKNGFCFEFIIFFSFQLLTCYGGRIYQMVQKWPQLKMEMESYWPIRRTFSNWIVPATHHAYGKKSQTASKLIEDAI